MPSPLNIQSLVKCYEGTDYPVVMANQVPDYSDDWREFWEFKSTQRERTQIRNAAQNPEQYYLTAIIQELDPNSGEYDWSINAQHLIEHPDEVLRSGIEGFSEFVAESDIDHARGSDYDILPIHISGLSKFYIDPSSFENLLYSANELTNFSAAISEVNGRSYKPTSVMYRCPDGHETRILQPIFQTNSIDYCGHHDCSNSVYPTSQGTTARQIVEFEVEYDDNILNCVTTGIHAKDRNYTNLVEHVERGTLTGIPRKVIDEGELLPVFEALYLDDSIR